MSTLLVIALLISAVMTGPFVTFAQAATEYPPCLTSQIEVTVGATLSNVTYDYSTSAGTYHGFSKEAIPVFFYNKSADCHLLMGGPSINAVRNSNNPRATSSSELALSAPVSSEKRIVVKHHGKVEALFLFGTSVSQKGSRCDPATATGILVQGYANPIASTGKFFPRRIQRVCFDSGVGAKVLNTGVAWATTN